MGEGTTSVAGNQDTEHLRLLVIFHYVVAGVMVLVGCFPIIHVAIGVALLAAPDETWEGKDAPPPFVPKMIGMLFTVVGSVIIVFNWTLATCLFFAGRCLAQRRRRAVCIVVAAAACLFFPFGTALGVFTIIVLTRPTVAVLFETPVAN